MLHLLHCSNKLHVGSNKRKLNVHKFYDPINCNNHIVATRPHALWLKSDVSSPLRKLALFVPMEQETNSTSDDIHCKAKRTVQRENLSILLPAASMQCTPSWLFPPLYIHNVIIIIIRIQSSISAVDTAARGGEAIWRIGARSYSYSQ